MEPEEGKPFNVLENLALSACLTDDHVRFFVFLMYLVTCFVEVPKPVAFEVDVSNSKEVLRPPPPRFQVLLLSHFFPLASSW